MFGVTLRNSNMELTNVEDMTTINIKSRYGQDMACNEQIIDGLKLTEWQHGCVMVNEGRADQELDGEMRKEVFAGVTWNRQATDADEWRTLY